MSSQTPRCRDAARFALALSFAAVSLCAPIQSANAARKPIFASHPCISIPVSPTGRDQRRKEIYGDQHRQAERHRNSRTDLKRISRDPCLLLLEAGSQLHDVGAVRAYGKYRHTHGQPYYQWRLRHGADRCANRGGALRRLFCLPDKPQFCHSRENGCCDEDHHGDQYRQLCWYPRCTSHRRGCRSVPRLQRLHLVG